MTAASLHTINRREGPSGATRRRSRAALAALAGFAAFAAQVALAQGGTRLGADLRGHLPAQVADRVERLVGRAGETEGETETDRQRPPCPAPPRSRPRRSNLLSAGHPILWITPAPWSGSREAAPCKSSHL